MLRAETSESCALCLAACVAQTVRSRAQQSTTTRVRTHCPPCDQGSSVCLAETANKPTVTPASEEQLFSHFKDSCLRVITPFWCDVELLGSTLVLAQRYLRPAHTFLSELRALLSEVHKSMPSFCTLLAHL